jgi:hypothetical protein
VLSASEKLAALVEKRSVGSLPLNEWGPVCVRCGYCSFECRDRYEYDEELALPEIVAVVKAAESLLARIASEGPTERREAEIHRALAALDEKLGER